MAVVEYVLVKRRSKNMYPELMCFWYEEEFLCDEKEDVGERRKVYIWGFGDGR